MSRGPRRSAPRARPVSPSPFGQEEYVTSANPSHARPGGPAQAWRLFRRWQRSRPFWGGLLTALAGLEMFASTRMTVNGLSFHSGASGLLSLLIPVILVTCGLLLWFTPAQRLFYSVVAAVTAVYSLIGLNLGGFFVGLLLGIVGSALAFAWTPVQPAAPDPDDAQTHPAAPAPDAGDVPTHAAAPDAGDASTHPAAPAPAPPDLTDASTREQPSVAKPDPRAFGIALVVLGLAAAGLAAQPGAVQAAPNRPTTTACPTPSRTVTPSPSRAAPSPSRAAPTPMPSPTRRGNLITDILDGIGDLLPGGRAKETPSPTVSPSGTPTTPPGPVACPSSPPVRPGRPATPDKPGTVQPGKPLPRIAADPRLPTVAQTPSKLTGSSVRMTGLRFDGITDLHTVKGDLTVLKFSMREAVTDDFLLRADGPAGRNQRYATDRLTVSGDVAFYATRFVGRLLGIKITLTPDLPLPEGLPITSPIPITFTDPAIDLAYVTSDTLTAKPALALSLG
ncbi:DUF6114 domain-containing protein [Micromonospora sp. WMMD961]|uniref:DUF6114 domain-containing protein n=1 Tax=Micromonospora sp. WMMD961 TaxID=3016100 RepID=UPI0024166847|nr:DUF6114 domain-containing protein [Micromonospora sp. WMMD961]MDG4778115.1 DUF6114 domain-containing protein [Micromonospora sp. WMMD961]